MDERKIIRLGNSSFAISLPINWIKKADLKKGDKISLVENSNGELIVRPEFKKRDSNKIEIDLKDRSKDYLKSQLHSAYIQGYNPIVLKGDIVDKKHLKNLLSDYLSFELIEENGEGIIIRDFFDVNEANFSNFLAKIDNNVREMFNLILEDLKKGELKSLTLKEIGEIDKSLNKFYFLSSRIFFRGINDPTVLNLLDLDSMTLFNNWWTCFHLESLGDGLKYFANWIDKSEKFNLEEISEILGKLNHYYLRTIKSVKNKNKEEAFKIKKETEQLIETLDRLEEKGIDHNVVISLELIRKNIYQISKIMSFTEI